MCGRKNPGKWCTRQHLIYSHLARNLANQNARSIVGIYKVYNTDDRGGGGVGGGTTNCCFDWW